MIVTVNNQEKYNAKVDVADVGFPEKKMVASQHYRMYLERDICCESLQYILICKNYVRIFNDTCNTQNLLACLFELFIYVNI